MADRQLTREDLSLAAYLHIAEGKTWEAVADQLQCDRRTLYNWRHRAVWQEVTAEVIAELRPEAAATAWGCLLRNAHRGETQAAKIILDRIEGKAPQKLEVTQDREKCARCRQLEAMTDEELRMALANLEAVDGAGGA